MTYYTFYTTCPHCGKKEKERTIDRKQLYGNPLRTCARCHKQYYDFSRQETAIYDYFQIITPPLWVSLVWPALFFFFAGMCVVMAIEAYFVAIVPAIIFFALGIWNGRTIFKELIAAINKEKYRRDKNLAAEIYFNEQENQNTELSASLIRLRNPEYLDFLIEHDVNVPDFFFSRINYTPPMTYQDKQKQKKEKQEDDLAKIKIEQQKFINASHYLRRGKKDKQFVMVAKEAGMSPEQFEEYCKNVIAQYDLIHQRYNQTHSTPIDYPEV